MSGDDTPSTVTPDLYQEEPERVRAHLARVLASPLFARAPRMHRFLEFLVQETLDGRAVQLKEYTIAVRVFGKPEDFDTGSSAIVRVEAGRLRRMLAQYRADYGTDDDLVIDVPKGCYVPVVAVAAPSAAEAADGELHRPAEGIAVLPSPWASHERRLVTVLACGFGPEVADLRLGVELVESFDVLYDRCLSVATAHGGHMEAAASGCPIIYFGWPNGLEDAAGQALTAALQLLGPAATGSSAGLSLRFGVATSEVVARSAGAEGRPAVIGEAPAAALLLVDKAPANGILVAESTRRLTRGFFDLVPAGSVDGRADGPNLVWRLLRATPQITRFKAREGETRARLVGRREEVALLLSRWTLAEEGEGQSVLLVGDAGIGKSKLAEAILEEIGDAATQLRAQCLPHHQNSALFPIVDLIGGLFNPGILAGEVDTVAAGTFLAGLGLDDELNRTLLSSLLSSPDDSLAPGLTASRQKDVTLRLLTRIFIEVSRRKPTILLVEDVHWSDPTTLELLEDLARSAVQSRLLILCTSRPATSDRLAQNTGLTAIRLGRLPRGQSGALVDALIDGAELPEAAREAILERAQGIPLFLEELTRDYLVNGLATARETSVPMSVSDLLVSQLDRLGSMRRYAQVAAVLGGPFTGPMLAMAAGVPDANGEIALDQLMAAGLLVRDGAGATSHYTFRHALLRDAAYNSLLAESRRELHYQVGNLLIDSFPEVSAEHPEVVAQHLTHGDRPDEALPFWIDAARKAAARYGLAEASSDYRHALAALALLPERPQRQDQELEILIQLGLTIRSARGYGDEQLPAIYERARALASALGKPEYEANAIYGLWTHAAGLGQWARALELADLFQPFAHAAGVNDQLRVEANRLRGASAAFTGDLVSARRHLEAVAERYDPTLHGPGFGFDPGAAAAAYLSWTLWHLGDEAGALRNAERALAIANSKAHPQTLAMVLSWLMFTSVCRDDVEAVLRLNAELQVVSAERDCRYWQPFGAACASWANFQRDRDPRHIDLLLRATSEFRERYFVSCLLLIGARMCLEIGQLDRAAETLGQSRRFVEECDERLWASEVDHLAAALQLAQPSGDREQARELLATALSTARAQKAVWLEQRIEATISRAGLRLSGQSDIETAA